MKYKKNTFEGGVSHLSSTVLQNGNCFGVPRSHHVESTGLKKKIAYYCFNRFLFPKSLNVLWLKLHYKYFNHPGLIRRLLLFFFVLLIFSAFFIPEEKGEF